MAEFRVVLENIKLSDEKHAAIAAEIQATVARYLADLDVASNHTLITLPSVSRGGATTVATLIDQSKLAEIPELSQALRHLEA